MALHYETMKKTRSSLPDSCLRKGKVFSPLLPRVTLGQCSLSLISPFLPWSVLRTFFPTRGRVLCCLINTEQNHMWAGLHYAIREDGLVATLQLAKVFLFGQFSRGGIELHCISFLIDTGCLKFTANDFFLLKEFLYSLKFLDQHEPANANSCFTSNY